MATTPVKSRFQPATRKKSKLRMALDGPSGSGKTYTALRLAFTLGARVALIDSEAGSASKYQGDSPDGIPWNFDVLELETFSPTEYTAAIEEAGRAGYDVIVIDSLSHAWQGKEGALELVSKKGGNSYTAWKDVTPMHTRMIDAILRSPCHLIATMRAKTEYVLETNDKGQQVPRKIGMRPIQRDGMEYEFDLYGSLDWSHVMTVTKSRCPSVDGLVIVKPGPQFMQPVVTWLETGVVAARPATYTPIMVGDAQIERIVGKIASLGRTLDKEKKYLFRKYAVGEFGGLTCDQAREYEATLDAALARRGGAATQASTAATPTPTDATPTAAGTPTNGNPAATPYPNPAAKADPITLSKLAAARELFFSSRGLTNLPEHTQARADLWLQVLAKRGVTTARDLTNQQCAELEAKLTDAVMKAESERRAEEADQANNETFQGVSGSDTGNGDTGNGDTNASTDATS